MRSVIGSQVNRLWLPAAASIGMATHAVNMDTDNTHNRSMAAQQGGGEVVKAEARSAGWSGGERGRLSGN